MKYFCLIFLALGLLGGCSEVNVFSKSDLFPHIGKRVAIFPVKPQGHLPESVWKPLAARYDSALSQFSSFSHVLTEQEQNELTRENPLLRQQIHRYTTTAALTMISDKDLVHELAPILAADQFLIVQAEEYPCTEDCPAPSQVLLRLILWDTASNQIIWRGRLHRQLTPNEEDPEMFNALMQELNEQLLETFQEQFRIPWHRLRYESLKKLRSS
ncbi:MAG: hypothetical protein HQM11_07990 [SAR324 cluster bacterium]|nr:hypothetical protein [SAR324 cluster bacterium]